MKIGIAQINTRVANTLSGLDYNLKKITHTIDAIWHNCDLIVFPEMTLTWYPLNDILDDDVFVKQQKEGVYTLQKHIQQYTPSCKILVWGVDYDESHFLPDGKMIKYNTVYLIDADNIETYYKKLLPDYDVFFEKRYFQSWQKELFFSPTENSLASVTICEDIWDENYDIHPINDIKQHNKNIDIVCNLSSSPFAIGKLEKRVNLLKRHHKNMPAYYVYVNQVWWQDELIFDGSSMILDKQGNIIYCAKAFEEEITIVDLDKEYTDITAEIIAESNNKYERIYHTLCLGLKDYLAKTGIQDVMIWVSWGVDSAVDITLLRSILSPDHIHAVYLPTQYNKNESFEYSKELCDNLWVHLDVYAIQDYIDTFEKLSNQRWDTVSWLRHENIQARIRWLILMDLAAKYNAVVINNSNQTEMAMWYATMYGDSIWFMSPIWDLNKKEVYELARWLNTNLDSPIPEGIITRAPSAELKDNQVDPFDYTWESEAIEDILYNVNPILVQEKYNLSSERITELYKMKQRNERKRRQYPIIIKVKERSLSIGRQVPIVQW